MPRGDANTEWRTVCLQEDHPLSGMSSHTGLFVVMQLQQAAGRLRVVCVWSFSRLPLHALVPMVSYVLISVYAL